MKTAKIVVDISMLVFIALSLVRWSGDPTFHIVVGSAFSILFITHFLLNLKTFVSMTKKFVRFNIKMKFQYSVDVILLILWCIIIVAGVIAAINYFNVDSSINGTGRLHGVLGRIGCGIILIHIIQHIKQIRSYFMKKRSGNEKAA